MDRMYAVILAGGRGERFWPFSTSRRPKQLLSLVGGKTLLAQAVDRLEGLIPAERVFVITNEDLVDATSEAAPQVPPAQIIGEPVGRDTAAAIALGAAQVKARDPGAAFCVLTADHVMGDLDRYRSALRESLLLARQEAVLITIGMEPTGPSTGYGYIEAGEPYCDTQGVAFLRARRFVEKPDSETAKTYLASGRFFWNSGMFIWSVSALEEAFQKHRPELAGLIDRLTPIVNREEFKDTLAKEYAALEKISIDYALIEKAENLLMARGTFAWDDVGSWPALANHFESDPQGNVVVGSGETLDAENNIVVSPDRLTALIGVSDLVVVQAEGATLICPRDRAQEVKQLVDQLKAKGTYDHLL